MYKQKRSYIICVFMLLACIILPVNISAYSSQYSNYLYTPTSIEKINNNYFIVDCWQHRVIYNNSLEDDIRLWKTLDDDLVGPHSIASDGEIYLVDDTERHVLKVYKENNGDFRKTQIVSDVGKRPHKVVYDPKTRLFYSLASTSQEIVALENKDGFLEIKYKKKLNFLDGSYVRSFSIIDNKMYFVSGPGEIKEVNFEDGSYEVTNSYSVPYEFYGMNHIQKIGSYYYITIYTDLKGEIRPRMLKMKELKQLISGDYYDITPKFKFKGTPYYFSYIGERIFITEIDAYSSVKSFRVINDQIVDVQTHYDYGAPREVSIQRKNEIFNRGV